MPTAPASNMIGERPAPVAFVSLGPCAMGRMDISGGHITGEVRVKFPASWTPNQAAAFLHDVGRFTTAALMLPATPELTSTSTPP